MQKTFTNNDVTIRDLAPRRWRMIHGSVMFLKHVEYRFVPVLAIRDTMLGTHFLGKLRRVTKIIGVVVVARCGHQDR